MGVPFWHIFSLPMFPTSVYTFLESPTGNEKNVQISMGVSLLEIDTMEST